MSGKFIAVLGCTLVCDNPTAQANITSAPSTKVKAGGKFIYRGPLNVTVAGATVGSFAQIAPVPGVIKPTAVKVMDSKMPVVLIGDKTDVPVMCPATDPSTGATTTIPVTVTITEAGQVKVKGA